MIARIWHGWTTPANADPYETLLRTEIFPGIAAKGIAGYRGIQLFRRPLGAEVEFVTLMGFDSWEAVKAFGGAAHVFHGSATGVATAASTDANTTRTGAASSNFGWSVAP